MVFYHKLLRIKSISNMESVLIIIISILCSILILNLLYKLRLTLLWWVNCWFCNNNFWVKFIDRNSWMCPNCEQYNGFTKDGDYNKVLNTANGQQMRRKPMLFQRSSPKNGLCKMCNVNQQLKVTLLAKFVPTSDRSYDTEIKIYRNQLEKAYKLCSPCRKVLDTKLHKDMKTMLGYKHLASRNPERKSKSLKKDKILQNCINKISEIIAAILLALVFYECCNNVVNLKNLSITVNNTKEIILNLTERFLSIIQMKFFATFPYFEKYIYNFEKVPILSLFRKEKLDITNEYIQELLGGFVCVIQIIGHLWSINKLKYSIVIDLLWSVFVIGLLGKSSLAMSPVVISFVKILSVLAVLLVYRNMKKMNTKIIVRKVFLAPKTMNWCDNSAVSDDENASADTDDDVSLSKYGLHNSGSSNGTVSPLNNSVMNGRSCTPRSSDSIWGKPKLNSTFCVNSVFSSPSSINDTVFVKPSFNKYQNISKDDSDSDLDESIGSLCISSPKKMQKKSNPIFSLRKFTATPSFVVPTPLNSGRPLISPSKLRASWVAGGYWGSEGDRTIFNINGSRSSSQSSGFESQGSSMTQRNVFSQPPSREESVCREPFRAATLSDRFQNFNMSYKIQTPQNFSCVSSPVFPQMHYNSHVHIPQPRFSRQNPSLNGFVEPQMNQNGVFKSPNSSLIKLPQINDDFTTH